MDKIDDFSNIESALNKTVEPIIIAENSETDELENNDDTDDDTLKLDDPRVWVFLSGGETQGLMNADFLEFFTI